MFGRKLKIAERNGQYLEGFSNIQKPQMTKQHHHPPTQTTTLLTHFYRKLLLAVPHCLLIACICAIPLQIDVFPCASWSGGIKLNRVESLNDQKNPCVPPTQKDSRLSFHTNETHTVDF